MEKFNFKSYDFLKYQELAIDYSIKLSIAIAIFIIGSWIVKKIVKIIEKTMTKGKMERSLQKFLSDLIKWSLKALLFITVLSQLGIATSSFIALIGAAGLALGLALQGSLANFAGGAFQTIQSRRPDRCAGRTR
jgi:small conductance mechanosensitive channel